MGIFLFTQCDASKAAVGDLSSRVLTKMGGLRIFSGRRTRTPTHTYTPTHTHTNAHLHARANIYPPTCTDQNACTHTRIHPHTHTYIHIQNPHVHTSPYMLQPAHTTCPPPNTHMPPPHARKRPIHTYKPTTPPTHPPVHPHTGGHSPGNRGGAPLAVEDWEGGVPPAVGAVQDVAGGRVSDGAEREAPEDEAGSLQADLERRRPGGAGRQALSLYDELWQRSPAPAFPLHHGRRRRAAPSERTARVPRATEQKARSDTPTRTPLLRANAAATR